MSKTTNKFSPKVRARAVWMVLDQESEYSSRWTVSSIVTKVGCTVQMLDEWVKKAGGRWFPAQNLAPLATLWFGESEYRSHRLA